MESFRTNIADPKVLSSKCCNMRIFETRTRTNLMSFIIFYRSTAFCIRRHKCSFRYICTYIRVAFVYRCADWIKRFIEFICIKSVRYWQIRTTCGKEFIYLLVRSIAIRRNRVQYFLFQSEQRGCFFCCCCKKLHFPWTIHFSINLCHPTTKAFTFKEIILKTSINPIQSRSQ